MSERSHTQHNGNIKKRGRVPKDAAVFVLREPVPSIRFWPCTNQLSPHLLVRHAQFRAQPSMDDNGIEKYAQRIPYHSDKKDLLTKTGRDYLEGAFLAKQCLTYADRTVFHFTFKVPGSSAEHHVLWDYQIGLVKMTAMFKALGYSKTAPSTALTANHGLKDISPSITGGALVAQGYWVPFEAAKALAANFCYEIRHALTPMFGANFPNMCLKPESADFAKWKIHPAIVQACEKEVATWKGQEQPNIVSPQRAQPCGNKTNTISSSPLRPISIPRTLCPTVEPGAHTAPQTTEHPSYHIRQFPVPGSYENTESGYASNETELPSPVHNLQLSPQTDCINWSSVGQPLDMKESHLTHREWRAVNQPFPRFGKDVPGAPLTSYFREHNREQYDGIMGSPENHSIIISSLPVTSPDSGKLNRSTWLTSFPPGTGPAKETLLQGNYPPFSLLLYLF
jgi:hypothetical protein